MNTAVDSLVTSIAEDAPPPSEGSLPSITGAVEQPAHGIPNAAFTAPGSTLDKHGTAHDPAIHETPPVQGVTGHWRKKRGRGAAKAKGEASAAAGGASVVGVMKPPEPPPHLNDAAVFVSLITGGHAAFLGEHWLAKQDEYPVLVEATRQYMEQTGGMSLPPWLGLAGAYAVYASSRFHHEKTKTRLADFAAKVRSAWQGARAFFARKVVKSSGQAQPAAPSPADTGPAPRHDGGDVGFNARARSPV